MRSTGTRAGTYLWLGLLGIIFVAPLAWMVSTSLKSPDEMANPDLNLLPREPTLESYEKILAQSQTPVFQWFVNSVLAATLQTALILITASMAAYALARMQFPGRRLMTGLVLVTLFVPPISLVIPNYLIVDQIGWVDSLSAVVVPGAAGAFGVFFLRQFFLSLPKELEEAAIIDGAGKFRVFWQVILPLSKPALATLALLSFLTNWNDFLWPLYVLVSPENLTLQPGLSTLQSAYQTDYAAMMAGGVIASVPVLLLFIATQRFVVEGVSRSGLKG
jgi:multiple sugar transport system permease protein